jgi:hypothetical protein
LHENWEGPRLPDTVLALVPGPRGQLIPTLSSLRNTPLRKEDLRFIRVLSALTREENALMGDHRSA